MKDEIISGKPRKPFVQKVAPLEDWKLRLTFENGEERLFDMKPYRYGVFTRLEDPEYFRRVPGLDRLAEWIGLSLRYALSQKRSLGHPINMAPAPLFLSYIEGKTTPCSMQPAVPALGAITGVSF